VIVHILSPSKNRQGGGCNGKDLSNDDIGKFRMAFKSSEMDIYYMNEFQPYHGMSKRQTVPPPVFPSNTKKLAIGGSRPPSAFRMSCANIPPTIAHTGENSWPAVVDSDLEIQIQFKTYSVKRRIRRTLEVLSVL